MYVCMHIRYISAIYGDCKGSSVKKGFNTRTHTYIYIYVGMV